MMGSQIHTSSQANEQQSDSTHGSAWVLRGVSCLFPVVVKQEVDNFRSYWWPFFVGERDCKLKGVNTEETELGNRQAHHDLI